MIFLNNCTTQINNKKKLNNRWSHNNHTTTKKNMLAKRNEMKLLNKFSKQPEWAKLEDLLHKIKQLNTTQL